MKLEKHEISDRGKKVRAWNLGSLKISNSKYGDVYINVMMTGIWLKFIPNYNYRNAQQISIIVKILALMDFSKKILHY